jgi:hypothetical protein
MKPFSKVCFIVLMFLLLSSVLSVLFAMVNSNSHRYVSDWITTVLSPYPISGICATAFILLTWYVIKGKV